MKTERKILISLVLVIAGLFSLNETLLAVSILDNFAKALSGNQTRQVQAPRQYAVQLPVGTIKKSANLRSGPGTSNPKVALLEAGSAVGIMGRTGDWYQVQAQSNGTRYTGWIYAPLVQLGGATMTTTVSPTGTPAVPASDANNPTKVNSDGSTVTYAGYSKEFLPVKKMLNEGDLEGVEKLYAEKEKVAGKEVGSSQTSLEKMGFLRWLESGTLAIDQGNFEASVEDFTKAEKLLDLRQQKSWLETLVSGGGLTAVEFVTGNEELQEYSGEGFERVLMLNYKSIAYLLDGKRKAYNVTRRAIDWQNLEKKAFEEKRRKVEQELAEQRKEKPEEGEAEVSSVEDRVAQDYAKYDKKALSVPSAYVNPFGYYVAGMVQEYESYDDWSLRDNARISYQKALELNPKSNVLKQAAKEMQKRTAPGGTRLVHVVVANGFVPEKKLLTYNINSRHGVVPIKLTLYEPDPTKVHRIEVQTTSGKRLAVLSLVADVEALVLRHQKDMEPFRKLKVVLATVGGQVVKGFLANLGVIGQAISNTREKMAAPDMRSWMSLPASIQAARLHIRKGVTRFKLVTYDKKGRKLASKVININKDSHDFVYARSLDKQLYAHAAKGLWMVSGQ